LKKEGVCLAAFDNSELRAALSTAEVVATFNLGGATVVVVFVVDAARFLTTAASAGFPVTVIVNVFVA